MNCNQIMAALSSDKNVSGNSFDDSDADSDYKLSLSVSYFRNYTP